MEALLAQYYGSILTLAGLAMVAVISPGPDFAIIVRNSLVYSRKTALLTALGIALGILVHVTYILLGLGLVIATNEWLLFAVKHLGAAYLIYIGYQGVRAKKTTLSLGDTHHRRDISAAAAVRSGFLTNALNPKCALFFISLFSVVVDPNSPWPILLIYGIILFIQPLVWFSFVAFCLSAKKTRDKFSAVGHWIERVTGSILIALAIKLLLTEL